MPLFPAPPAARLLRLLSCALALSGAAAGAAAQDVELYDRPDFGGLRLTLGGAEADLARYGLGARVSSVVVTRGQWEFCTQPQFRGACITVGPGRYDRLPPALNDNLASLRPTGAPVGGPVTPPRPEPPPRGPAIVLYGGESGTFVLRVDEPLENLSRRGFNDLATHIDVLAGTWELCSDGGFGGQCLRFGPGRHALPPALRDRLSSLRPLGFGPGGPEGPGGPRGPGGPDGRPWPGGPDPRPWPRGPDHRPWPHAAPALVLHEHRDGSGRELALSAAVPDLGALGFNDQASSVEVFRGRWQLCRHADFQGECVVFGPGRHALDGRLNDGVSSLRPLYGRDDRPVLPPAALTLHEGPDLRGRALYVDGTVYNLRDQGFNDRAQVVEVHAGRWELCSASDFRGRCLEFGPGWHRLPEGLAGELSSLRPR